MDNCGGSARPVLSILPEEMWEKVFSYMYSLHRGSQFRRKPSEEGNTHEDFTGLDLLSCSRVCPEFEKILQPTRTIYLWSQVFPIIFRYLERNDVLRCRQICKEWNIRVDEFLREMTHHYAYDEISLTRKRYSGSENVLDYFGKDCYHFRPAKEKLDIFSWIFRWRWIEPDEVTETPCILKSFYWYHEPECEVFYRLTRDILPKFGWSITQFGFKACMSQSVLLFKRRVEQCLSLLVNLKCLEVSGTVSWNGEDSCSRQKLTEVSLAEISPKLRIIRADKLEDPSFMIQTWLPDIHSDDLACFYLRVSADINSIRVSADLPNLKELHLSISSLDHVETFLLKLTKGCSAPKLVQLGFLITSDFAATPKTLPTLFRMCNLFGATLRSIQIDGGGHFSSWEIEDMQEVQLRCDLLESIKISNLTGLSLNFLLDAAPTLETFLLEITSEREYLRSASYPNEVSNFYDYLESGSVYKSNIWEVLPKLEFVKCEYSLGVDKQREFYTRNVYRGMKSQKNN